MAHAHTHTHTNRKKESVPSLCVSPFSLIRTTGVRKRLSHRGIAEGPQVTMEMKGFLQIRETDALTQRRVNASRRRMQRTAMTQEGKANIRRTDGSVDRTKGCGPETDKERVLEGSSGRTQSWRVWGRTAKVDFTPPSVGLFAAKTSNVTAVCTPSMGKCLARSQRQID